MNNRARGKSDVTLCMEVYFFHLSGLCAQEEIKEMTQGSAYITARTVVSQTADATATLHEPGVFVSKHEWR